MASFCQETDPHTGAPVLEDMSIFLSEIVGDAERIFLDPESALTVEQAYDQAIQDHFGKPTYAIEANELSLVMVELNGHEITCSEQARQLIPKSVDRLRLRLYVIRELQRNPRCKQHQTELQQPTIDTSLLT